MEFSNSITRLFGIRYPIIQAGMVWNSGWRLASAVSNAGGLGLIGSGSMYPDLLQGTYQEMPGRHDSPFRGEYSADIPGCSKTYRNCNGRKNSHRFYFSR